MTNFVPVDAYRSRVESAAGGIEVTMPSRRNYVVAAFFAVWLCFWFYSLFEIVPQLFRTAEHRSPVLFLAAWTTLWIVGGCSVLAMCVWNIAGRERVTVGPDGLSIRREAAGVGRTRHYALRSVKALRAVDNASIDAPFGGFGRGDPFGTRSGSFAFDYGAKTVRFGAGVDAAEAKHILSKLIAAKPSLAEKA